MTTNFPTSLDSLTTPSGAATLGGSTPTHTGLHTNVNDAVTALETKVGVDSSAVTSSLDYKVANRVQVGGDIGGTAASPQVTATHLGSALPINQGGTGSTSQNFVDLSNAQASIGGAKTFTAALTASSGLTVTGAQTVSTNLLVGASSALGDNGTGELQLKDVTSAPTTNPTAGNSIYSASTTAVPLRLRDPSGNVRGLVQGWAKATADQTSVSTTQTSSTYLTLAVEANASYKVEAWVYWTTASSSTVTTSWTGPSGATMIWNDTTTGGDIVTTLTGVAPSWTTGTKMVNLYGVLNTSSTAGSLTFTWASSVSASVTVKTGSYLFLNRIA